MITSINEVSLLGNLGQDPEIRHLQNGGSVANLSVATSDGYKDKSGEWVNITEWHNVVVWDESTIDHVVHNLKKGSKVYLKGKLKTRSYEQNGTKKYSTEVVIEKFNRTLIDLGGKPEIQHSGNEAQSSTDQAINSFENAGGVDSDDSDLFF